MIYWRVAEVLARRGWTRYRLVQASGLAAPVVYRVAKKGAPVLRIDGGTLDTLCAVLAATPGQLLEHVPGGRKPPARRRR